MIIKDRYAGDENPQHCGHPRQRPFTLPNPCGDGARVLHAVCKDCGEEWPK